MAAQYTEVTLQDMETFLKRGFRALRPQKGHSNGGEYYYDLQLSDAVHLRIWTSIRKSSDMGAGVGEDAIRVQMMGVKSNRPLMKGKAPIVKRTQGWKNSLQNRIEDAIEAYEEKPEYWDASGSKSPETPKTTEPSTSAPVPSGGPRATDPQLKYLGFLTSRIRSAEQWAPYAKMFPDLKWPFTRDDLRKLSIRQAATLIDLLKNSGGSRYADDYDYSR